LRGAGVAVGQRGGDRLRARYTGRRGQRGGGVQQHDVPHRAGLPGQHRPGHLGVMRRVTAAQVGQRGRGQPEIGGRELRLGHLAVVHDPHRGRAGGGQLVEPVGAVEDQGRTAASGQYARDSPAHRRVEHPHRLGGRPGRVGHRAEEVEHGRDAEFAAGRARVAQRRVVQRREQERHAHLGGQFGGRGGRQVDDHAERLQHIGGAARGRRGPVPVLDHPHTRRGGHDRAHGGHVDRARPVSAGAHQVGQVTGHADRRGVREHGPGQPGHLGHRRALDPQRDPEPRDLGGRRRPLHDLVHGPLALVRGQRVAADQRAEQRGPRRAGIHGSSLGWAWGRKGWAWEKRSGLGGENRVDRVRRGQLAPARARIRPASSWASVIGSTGWLITASAPDQVASQPSSARPTTSSTGGQL